MSNFLKNFSEYNDTVEKQAPTYSGLLGLGINGNRQVNISSRPGFVYVRLRDNLSEVIQVYNDKVSPIYDFPVIIQRSGNRWVVIGKDTNRYETWATPAPFLPAHAGQHSFNRDANLGGDAVFVFPDQFMPLLVYPSGTTGAGMLMVAPYLLQRASDFIYVGNTGTQNLLVYKPTTNQAIMGLVVMNTDSGNPEVLIASGTSFSASLTGTASVSQYIPQPTSNQEPLYAFRLVSGTQAIGWGNLYNARQLVGGQGGTSSSGINVWDEGVPDGAGIGTLDFVGTNVDITVSGTVARVFVTGSSGGSLPTLITGSIPYAGANGQLTENNPLLRWDETYRGVRLGRTSNFPILNFADVIPIGMVANNPNEVVAISGISYGTGTSGSPSFTINGYRARGTGSSVLSPVQSGDALLSVIGAGYDGANWINGSRIRLYADGNWVTGAYTPTRMDFEVTPSGSTTRRTQFQIYGNAVEIPTGSTYNVGGVPHTHTPAQIGVRELLTAGRTYYVRTDGSDSNTGLANTSGGAFLTIQKAVDVVSEIDINGKTVTIQVGDGTYTGAVTLKNVIGYAEQGNLVIQGNAGTPTNVVVSVTSNNAFSANNLPVTWDIKNLKITTTTSGNCLFARYGSVIRFSGVDFGTCAGSHISAQVGGIVLVFGNYTVSGNATTAHYQASSNGFVGQTGSYTMTLTANVSITTWANCTTTGIMSLTGATYTLGAFAVTGKKYDVSINGVVFSAVTMPGGTAGTTASGGQYV